MNGNVGRFVASRLWSVRSFVTSSLRRGGHDDGHHDIGGIPGANLPFQIRNRYRLALTMGVFMGSGFATPFLLLRHQLKKKNQGGDDDGGEAAEEEEAPPSGPVKC